MISSLRLAPEVRWYSSLIRSRDWICSSKVRDLSKFGKLINACNNDMLRDFVLGSYNWQSCLQVSYPFLSTTCLWILRGLCLSKPLRIAYNLLARWSVPLSVGKVIGLSVDLSTTASSRSNSESANTNQALKANAKSRQWFWSSSVVKYPKNSGHLTTFDASLKLFLGLSWDSLKARAASAAASAALAALLTISLRATACCDVMFKVKWMQFEIQQNATANTC